MSNDSQPEGVKAIEEQARKDGPYRVEELPGPPTGYRHYKVTGPTNTGAHCTTLYPAHRQRKLLNAAYSQGLAERTRAGEGRWIPVSTIPDPNGEQVLTVSPRGIELDGRYPGFWPHDTTHWQELPDPPSTDPR